MVRVMFMDFEKIVMGFEIKMMEVLFCRSREESMGVGSGSLRLERNGDFLVWGRIIVFFMFYKRFWILIRREINIVRDCCLNYDDSKICIFHGFIEIIRIPKLFYD